MYREYTTSIRIILLGLLVLGMASCSLKFGAAARQAAENADKNPSQSKFVDMDNTKAEPEAKKAASLDNEQPAQTAGKAAHYVRSGKNRHLIVIASQSTPEIDNAVAKKKVAKDEATNKDKISAKDIKQKKEPTIKHVAQKGSLHQKIISNIRSLNQKIINKLTRQRLPQKKILYPTVQLYGAKIDQSKWLLTSTELECSLTQPIPQLGKAKFKYNSVQGLKFIFEVNHPLARNLEEKDKRYDGVLLTDQYPYPDVGAKLESVPPHWKPFAIKKLLGYIPFKEGNEPFVLPHRQRLEMSVSQKMTRKRVKGQQQLVSINNSYLPEIWPDRLIGELDDGMSIRLTYRDWIDGTEDIVVTISPINFKKIEGKFEKCINKRPEYHFNKLQRTVLHFNKGERSLSKKMRRQLRNVVKFAKLDDSIKKVMIKSYTDSMGFKRVNRNAAKVQAQAIKTYMKKRGMQVPITAIGIGEGPYVASNRSRAGRAKNRRSIITLIK